LTTTEFIESIIDTYNVHANSSYKLAKPSSRHNMLFGDHEVDEWVLPLGIDDDGTCCYHAHHPFPAPEGLYSMNSESDGVTYCTNQLILPVLMILSRTYPGIDFAVNTEVTLPVTVKLKKDAPRRI
jgi:hypothetical protein